MALSSRFRWFSHNFFTSSGIPSSARSPCRASCGMCSQPRGRGRMFLQHLPLLAGQWYCLGRPLNLQPWHSVPLCSLSWEARARLRGQESAKSVLSHDAQFQFPSVPISDTAAGRIPGDFANSKCRRR